MITPIIMLMLLIGPCTAAKLLGKNSRAFGFSGLLGLTLVFIFTGVGHFIKTAPMTEMLPPFFPFRVALVHATGILEFAAGLLILVPRFRRPVAWGLAIMLVLFLPVNIYAAIERVPMGGHAWGPIYLLLRVPLQLILLGWTYHFAIRRNL